MRNLERPVVLGLAVFLIGMPAAAQTGTPPGGNRLTAETGGSLPPNTTALAKRAAAAFAKRDWDEARAAYQEMLKLDEANALVWANLGAVEQQAGREAEAVAAFEKSVLHNPALVQSWNALGLIHAAKGDSYLAMAMFGRAIHEDPADAKAHNYLAIAAKSLGWTDAAETELQRAIKLDPNFGIAHFNLALMYLDQKPAAVELARRHYQKALALGVGKDELVERRLAE